jgi:hypothetical protein
MTTPDLNTALELIAKNSATPEEPEAFKFDFHPLAERFPLMERDDLFKLADDILAHGLLEPITLFEGKILDGRNRYLACKELATFKLTHAHFRHLPAGLDPLAFVISANIHRRHLTAEQKRDLLATLIKIDPSKSNRAIAAEAKVDDKTVAAVRGELEATAEIPQLETTTGKDGKKRRTRKGGSPKGKGSSKGSKGRSEKELITYFKVTDATTAKCAYNVLEAHLLDAVEDMNKYSSFAHADEYALRTIEKLQEKLDQMQPEEQGEE